MLFDEIIEIADKQSEDVGEDENGNISGSAELWKRELQVDKSEYRFDWKWCKNDTLYAHIKNIGKRLNMEPKLHHANYFKKGKFNIDKTKIGNVS